MRKRFLVFLCALLVLPVLSFFGCGDVSNFVISASVNDAGYGRISGFGTFSEGSSITLTADANSDKKFVAWVFGDTNMLSNESPYSISTDSNGLKSTISFKVSKETAGKYTAIFEDENMMWTKFESIRFSKSETAEEKTEEMLTADINLYNGTNSASLEQVISETDISIKEDVAQEIETNKLLYTSFEKQNQILLRVVLKDENSTRSFDLRANFACKTNDFVEIHTDNYDYDYKVTYNNGYEIVFKYPVSETEFNYIFLKYVDLGK